MLVPQIPETYGFLVVVFQLPNALTVKRTSTRSTYDEPTVMWRMRRGSGLSTHAVIGSSGDGAYVMWYLNGSPVGVRNFEDWTSAIEWTDRMQFQNWTVGWRLAQETDDALPSGSPS
jgi:hypothetical protein